MTFHQRWTDQDLLDELQRFAATVDGPVTTSAVDRGAKVSASTLRRRFGSWRGALDAAGLSSRYVGREQRPEWRARPGAQVSNVAILAELRRVAGLTGRQTVTGSDLERHAPVVRRHLVSARFGSMNAALAAAGLQVTRYDGPRTHAELVDNLRVIWRHVGGPPTTADLDRSPSTITSKTYRNRFGSHRAALAAVR